MRFGNVKGFEIVPFVFDLRPFGHGEAQAAHDVFQFLDRLRQRMQVAHHDLTAGQRRVKRLAAFCRAAAGQACLRRGQRGIQFGFHLIKSFSSGGFGRPRHGAQSLLHGFEPPAFGAEKFHSRRFDGCRIRGAFKRRLAGRGKFVEFVQEQLQRHERLAVVKGLWFVWNW